MRPAYGRGKCDTLLAGTAAIREHGHEQALACQQPLAGPEERAHDSRAPLLGAVAEDGLHLDAGRHVHHRARFGHRTFAGIQLHFDELHVFADDLEIDVVSAAARRRCRAAAARPAWGSAPRQTAAPR